LASRRERPVTAEHASGLGQPLRRRDWSVAFKQLLILLSVVLVVGQLCGHEFNNLDDVFTIYNNPKLNPSTVANILYYWNPANAEGELWVPVTNTFWGILAFAGRLEVPDPIINTWLNPWVFHSANVLVHLATALVVFQLLREILAKDWAACAGAVLFAVHPVQVETVAWTSGGKDLLCGLFTLLSVLAFVQSGKLPEDAPRRRRLRWASLGWMVLGMLSKPTAVVTPVFLVVLDRAVFARPWKQIARSVWPWFAMAIPCMVWTKLIQPAPRIWVPPVMYRPLIATDALAFYMQKIVLPLQNCFDYGRHPQLVIDRGWIYYTWAAPAIAALVLWHVRRRLPLVVAGVVLAAAGLLPVLGFVPFDYQARTTVTDHYLYLPMAGVALAIATALAKVPARAARPVAAIASIVLLAFGIRAWFAAGVWKDNRTLYSNVIHVNPDSWLACNNLGDDYFTRGCYLLRLSDAQKQNNEIDQSEETHQFAVVEFEQAEKYFRDASRACPQFPEAKANTARALAKRGLLAEATPVACEAIALSLTPRGLPTAKTALYGRLLADLYLRQGMYQGAIACLERVLEITPGDPLARRQLEVARQKLRDPASPPPATEQAQSSPG
jgi:protein O-mannosyl-transferase